MPKIDQLEVSIFEWPERFFIEADGPDRDYQEFYPGVDEETPPHFVDLGEYVTGWCSCRDFSRNVFPFLNTPDHRRTCKHILAAWRYRYLMFTKPKTMPTKINYADTVQ